MTSIVSMIATGGVGQLMTWIEIALVIFFCVFMLIVVGVVLRRRGHFDEAARIPLDDASPGADTTSEG
jgi:cbb3-type cytochrome oxidase subunit 3